jgi:hypothetical protein
VIAVGTFSKILEKFIPGLAVIDPSVGLTARFSGWPTDFSFVNRLQKPDSL